MSRLKQYERFTPEDRQYLRVIAKNKWWAMVKRFVISFSLPFLCALAVVIYLFLIVHGNGRKPSLLDLIGDFEVQAPVSPHTPSVWSDPEFWVFILTLLTPVFFIIAIGNIVMFLNSIPPFYYDLLRGRKKLIEFRPSPYTMSGNYYIQTNVPIKPFIEVSYEDYMSVDYYGTYIMEVTPVTKIFLRIRPKHV